MSGEEDPNYTLKADIKLRTMRLWNMNFRLQLVKLCLEDIKPSQNVRQAPFEAEHAGDPKKWHVNCSYVLSGSQRCPLEVGILMGKSWN